MWKFATQNHGFVNGGCLVLREWDEFDNHGNIMRDILRCCGLEMVDEKCKRLQFSWDIKRGYDRQHSHWMLFSLGEANYLY